MNMILVGFLWFFSSMATDLPSIEIINNEGHKLTWKDFDGKALMIVNIATHCGYTSQLDGLEKIYQKYKSKGFEVVAVPSNDFLRQTPESNEEVKKFCKLRYGVTFPITDKVVVKGSEKHPLAQFLTENSPKKGEIGWNFEKFILSKDRKIVGRFKSSVKPEDPEIEKVIESTLTTK